MTRGGGGPKRRGIEAGRRKEGKNRWREGEEEKVGIVKRENEKEKRGT